MEDSLAEVRIAELEDKVDKMLVLLNELKNARPILLYGTAWIERIETVIAEVEKS